MNKKRILILIIFVCILFITILSFFLIKNKSDKMEKFEISDSEKSENNNSENVNDGTESSSDGNSNVNKENNNKNTDLDSDNNSDNNVSSEEDVVSYFEKNYNEIDSTNWDNIKDKAKGYFITIVDFIFYNGEIKGRTFNELSTSAKLKIISIALKIDNKIEKYVPGYKETLSDKYNNVKEKLVTLYLDLSVDICKNHEDGCNTAKEIFKDIKDSCKIGWDFIKGLLSAGTSKLKDWYEIYSGK